jgi:hypothetical protein
MHVQKGVADHDVSVDKLVDLDKLDAVELVGKHRVHKIGIGIAQSPRGSALAGTIWVVVIYL